MWKTMERLALRNSLNAEVWKDSRLFSLLEINELGLYVGKNSLNHSWLLYKRIGSTFYL